METFTLFIILPSKEVCSLRQLTTGVSGRDVRCMLEMKSGLPAGIYRLNSSDGLVLHEDHEFVLHQNVWDGFLIRVELLASWQALYDAVFRGDVGWMLRSGAVHLGPGVEGDEDGEKTRDIISERGTVALFIASWTGAVKVVQGLLSVGVNPNGRTPFQRTPIFAAAIRDNDRILEALLTHGAKLSVQDCQGDTPLDVARRHFSRQCINRIRTLQLIKKGHKQARKKTSRASSLSSLQRASVTDRFSETGSAPNSARDTNPLSVSVDRPLTAFYEKRRGHQGSSSACSRSSLQRSLDYNFKPSSRSHQQPASNSSTSRSAGGLSVGESVSAPTSPDCRSAGAKLRVAVPPSITSKPGRKSNHVVTWDASLTDSETLRIKSARREGKIDLRNHLAHSSFPTPSPRTPEHVSWYLFPDSNHQPTQEAPGRPPSGQGSHSELSIVSAPGPWHLESGMKDGVSLDMRSVESAPGNGGITGGKSTPHHETAERLQGGNPRISSPKKSMHSRRFLVSRQKDLETWKTAKRQIQLAEQQKHSAKGRPRESFEEWLQRKRMEERQEGADDSSSDRDDDDNEENAKAFEEWLKVVRQRPLTQPNPNSAASLHRRKTRALQGLIQIGHNTDGEPMNEKPDVSSYMHSLQDWRQGRRRGSKRGSDKEDSTLSSVEAKKQLESKRQQLLAIAVSFDEWMEHAEERKRLMKMILQADAKELEKIEKAGLSNPRGRGAITFQQWKVRMNAKEAQLKDQQLRMRKELEEEKRMREEYRSSACVPHKDWLRQKAQQRQQLQLQQQQQQQQQQQHQQQDETRSRTEEKESGFNAWVKNKHQSEVNKLDQGIRKERQMLLALRERKQLAASRC